MFYKEFKCQDYYYFLSLKQVTNNLLSCLFVANFLLVYSYQNKSYKISTLDLDLMLLMHLLCQ